mgnify:CR=1 FL=1
MFQMRLMSFRLIDSCWDRELCEALAADRSTARVMVPFIKFRSAQRLLQHGRPQSIRVITRFHLGDFSEGVSDLSALRLLLEAGAKIRGVRNLHSKVYVFGDSRAIVTSANLTEAALTRNHEFGFVADDSHIVRECRGYFDQMWERAGQDLQIETLDQWDATVTAHLARGGQSSNSSGLGDKGENLGFSDLPLPAPAWVESSQRAFVKFFGDSDHRAKTSSAVLDEVRESESHWACSYPKGKRPRQVEEGSTIFIGRLVSPGDVVIYGRAIALRHVEGRDDATQEDIKRRPWRESWPHLVRLHHAEFLSGTLENGVSLNELMNRFGEEAFVSTSENARRGKGNVNPRGSLRQKPSVELTPVATEWLNSRLSDGFARHGKLTPSQMETLHWPEYHPTASLESFQGWLQTSKGLKSITAREYVYFLRRCMDHYDVTIDSQAVPNEEAADRMVSGVRDVFVERGKWTDKAFDERDIDRNLRPALRAFGKFCEMLKKDPTEATNALPKSQ